MEADVADIRKANGVVVLEDTDEDGDVEVASVVVLEDADEDEDVKVADDERVKVAAARTDDGIEDNACIVLGSGNPPALPSSSSPHVLGSTLSMDVMMKNGVLAPSSPEKFSSCMWQAPFCLKPLYGKD